MGWYKKSRNEDVYVDVSSPKQEVVPLQAHQDLEKFVMTMYEENKTKDEQLERLKDANVRLTEELKIAQGFKSIADAATREKKMNESTIQKYQDTIGKLEDRIKVFEANETSELIHKIQFADTLKKEKHKLLQKFADRLVSEMEEWGRLSGAARLVRVQENIIIPLEEEINNETL